MRSSPLSATMNCCCAPLRRSGGLCMRYLKIVRKDDRLLGIFGINAAFDPGVMWELILRRIDLGPVRERFLRAPQETARALMSRTWR